MSSIMDTIHSAFPGVSHFQIPAVTHFPLQLNNVGPVTHFPIQPNNVGPAPVLPGVVPGMVGGAVGGGAPTPAAGGDARLRAGATGAHHGENPLSALFTGPLAGEAQTDEQHAGNVASHLMQALQAAKDPNLKESLSNALAAIHKHIAGHQKERHQALQGKLSPRLMEMAQAAGGNGAVINGNPPIQIHGFGPGGAVTGTGGGTGAPVTGQTIDTGYNPAAYRLATGDTAQAAADWEAHHPAAMASRHIPGWLQAYLASQIAAVSPAAAQAAYTSAPAPGLAVS